MDITICAMQPEDWEQVREIYEQGIEGGNATFETAAPSWEDWDRGHIPVCRIVAKIENKICGWAVLSPISSRCVYTGVAEESIYIHNDCQRRGVGKALLNALIAQSEEHGFWTLQAGIFPENEASIALHQKCGFRVVGVRERIGKMSGGQWRDVVLLERRSAVVGVE